MATLTLALVDDGDAFAVDFDTADSLAFAFDLMAALTLDLGDDVDGEIVWQAPALAIAISARGEAP